MSPAMLPAGVDPGTVEILFPPHVAPAVYLIVAAVILLVIVSALLMADPLK